MTDYAKNINSLPVPLPKDINDPSFLPALNRILIGLQNNINSNNIINGSITSDKIKSLAATKITGTIPTGGLDIADQGWIQTCNFAVTDADTISWGAGIFKAADGTTYSIGAGNTGNMVARTYIYLDIAISVTAYQTTTNVLNCIGLGKVMIATAINGTVEAEYLEFNSDQMNINASKIVAGSITANEIAAETITAAKMAANTITADKIIAGAFTTAQQLANGDFEDWNAGTSAVPDSWAYQGSGGHVERSNIGTCKLGSYSALMQRVGNNCNLYQDITAEKGLAYWKGKTVTFSCWVLASVANTTRLHVEDGYGASTYSSYHTGDGYWQLLTVTHTISNSAAYFAVMCDIETTDTGSYFDGAMCVEGSYAMAYAPSWKNTIRKLVVGSAAFSASAFNSQSYTKNGQELVMGGETEAGYFYASIELPDGAIVNSLMSYYFRNYANAVGTVKLQRSAINGSAVDTMATITFTGTGGRNNTTTTSISNATINNAAYSYFMEVYLYWEAASAEIAFYSAIIKYIAPSPLP